MITYIVIILAAVLVALVAVFAILMWFINNREERRIKNIPHYRHDVIINGGVDIDTGRLKNNANRHFNGMKDNDLDTICLKTSQSGRLHPVGDGVEYCITLIDERNGQRYAKRFRNELIIGRNPSTNGISCLKIENDGSISSNHCRIIEDNGIFCIEDLGSANHTYLNGGLLCALSVLNNGDSIKIGKTKFQVFFSE